MVLPVVFVFYYIVELDSIALRTEGNIGYGVTNGRGSELSLRFKLYDKTGRLVADSLEQDTYFHRNFYWNGGVYLVYYKSKDMRQLYESDYVLLLSFPIESDRQLFHYLKSRPDFRLYQVMGLDNKKTLLIVVLVLVGGNIINFIISKIKEKLT